MKRTIVLLLVLVSTLTAAQQNTKQLSDYVKAYDAVHQLSGSVLVASKGKVIYRESFGKGNRQWNVSNTNDTRYWIASIAKQFTAAAILQLEEQGRLSTSDKLSKYFPDYPKGDAITLHMLLNHTSGIKECSENPKFFNIDETLSGTALKDTLIGMFKDAPLDFEPGTFWHYSNSGYVLLGYIIEQVSGMEYADYLDQKILQRAGMKNSGVMQTGIIVPQLADGYSLNQNKWTKARNTPANLQNRVGGIYATTADLLLWREALDSGKIINAASLAKMNQPNQPNRGAGYGIFIDEMFGHKVFQHQGAGFGFNTFMADFPDDGTSIIVLANRDTNLDFLPKALAAIVFGKQVMPPYPRKPVKINTAVLPLYAGTYAGDLPFPVNIIAKEGRLFLQLGRDIALVAESQTKFYIDEPDVEMQFEFEMEGQKVQRAYCIESGVRYEIWRK